MKFLKNLSLVLFLIVIASCSSPSTHNNLSVKPYRIILTEPNETNSAANLEIRLVLDNENATDNEKRAYLLEVYNEAKLYNKFKEHEAPTSISIFMYTSERRALENKSGYIANLWMVPGSEAPEISFGLLQKTTEQDESRMKYDSIVAYFKTKGADFCEIFYDLNALIKESHQAADAKYDISDSRNLEYHNKYYDEKAREMVNKFGISDTMLTEIYVFGEAYCK